jgi:L-histidine Nalpha-methyltransferase
VRYFPVDISAAALEENVREVGRLEGVEVEPLQASHFEGLRAAAERRRPQCAMLALFLGGNIGNFDRSGAAAFIGRVREALRPGDALMIAADLEKPEEVLLAAYDDPIGLTAAFNLNVLARLNRELGADFDLKAFAHRAAYDRKERRVEMHLVSKVTQAVHVRALGLEVAFVRGEILWTESSYRFAPGELVRMCEAAGFQLAAEWTDHEWPFAQTLLLAR